MGDDVGTLFVCAVPIGNLEDASPRLRRVLGSVDVIACEDTRTTGRLLELLEITPRPRLLAHHEHNERASAAGIVALLETGEDIALVSDAGTPGVSDPGVILVDAALDAGIEVVVVPGPSAAASAIAVAGFRGTSWRFVGFLPRRRGELEELLEATEHDVVVAFEAPSRLGRTLEALCEVQPGRRVAACRELTKLHEEIVRGTADELLERFGGDVKGELVLVLEALLPTHAADERSAGLVTALVDGGMRPRDAAKIVASHLGGNARELYDAVHAHRHDDE
jgi:16S rRNA (cytidine1402-2'-O)-methyltransferase